MASGLIDVALETVDREGQVEQARRLARRRLPALQRTDALKGAGRLRDYLLRRGFPVGVVVQVVRECLKVSVD